MTSIKGPAPENRTPPPMPVETVRLANAMVGKPFRAEIDLAEYAGAPFHEEPSFHDWLGGLGFSARVAPDAPSTLVISGTPTSDGEHFFFLDFEAGEKIIKRRELLLTVNPDPRSLWKELEPDENLPYPKPHTDSRMLEVSSFTLLAGSRRGRSHAHAGSFREDDFALFSTDNGWFGAVVSDGAGSCKFSREGSRLACRTVADTLTASLATLPDALPELVARFAESSEEDIENALRGVFYGPLAGAAFAAFKRIEQEATSTGVPLKEFSATLLMAAAKTFENGLFIAGFGIGDGAIGVFEAANDSVTLLNLPDGGEFSGQTRFLTMREVIGDGGEMARRIRFGLFQSPTFAALMTDGISDPKFGTDRNLQTPAKWAALLDELKASVPIPPDETAPERLVEWLSFWTPGEHDDRTLALVLPNRI